MRWRCEWCGRPHEEDDPPCEGCGHFKFEEAVQQVVDPDAVSETTEWTCAECGRLHPKNSPPCSRCGHMTLEARAIDWDERTPNSDAGGYLDVGRRYVVLGVAAVAVAGAAAVLRPTDDLPEPPSAPGDATSSAGLDLETVAERTLEVANEVRRGEGLDSLTLDRELTFIATYANRGLVDTVHGDRETLPVMDLLYDEIDRESPGYPVGTTVSLGGADDEDGRSIEHYESEAELAETLTEALFDDERGERVLLAGRDEAGIDVHVAPNGAVYTTVTTA